MLSIRPGDLYFLRAPFHVTDDDVNTEKRLSYLLGTVSSRPAVVIRGPSWWDHYNTITVIPAITKGSPAIELHLQDRYGRLTEACYPFMPHNPHTIPVSRLGNYIGSLDEEELQQILYAFQWIHDPTMQADPNCPVPECYREVMEKEIPASWKMNKDARSNVKIYVKPEDGYKLESPTHPELDGFSMMPGVKIDHTVEGEISSDIPFVPVENPLPDAGGINPEQARAVPVEKSFPPSMFPESVLKEVAGRFTISNLYYDNRKTVRDPNILNRDEILMIQKDAPKSSLDRVTNIYRQMTPMDAFLLGPRLPLNVLANITDLDRRDAAILKRMCNIMRDMSEDEYRRREAEKHDGTAVQALPAGIPSSSTVRGVGVKDVPIPADAKLREVLPKITDPGAQEDAMAKLRVWLNPSKFRKMPTAMLIKAYGLPRSTVKKGWTTKNTKQFDSLYDVTYTQREAEMLAYLRDRVSLK